MQNDPAQYAHLAIAPSAPAARYSAPEANAEPYYSPVPSPSEPRVAAALGGRKVGGRHPLPGSRSLSVCEVLPWCSWLEKQVYLLSGQAARRRPGRELPMLRTLFS